MYYFQDDILTENAKKIDFLKSDLSYNPLNVIKIYPKEDNAV